MPTSPCPGCQWPVEHDPDAATIGCPMVNCRVAEFHPHPQGGPR